MIPEDLGGGLLRLFRHGVFYLLMLALLIGCAFMFLIGVVLFWRAAYLSRYGVRIEGRVVGNHVYPGDSEGTRYRVVEFTDRQGKTQRRTLSISAEGDAPVGGSMLLVYNPDDPGEVSGASPVQLWMVPLLCCGFGGIGVLVMIGFVSRVFLTN